MVTTIGFYGDLRGSTWICPLVNVYRIMERATMLLMGKLTIPIAIFNKYVELPEGKHIKQMRLGTIKIMRK